MPRIMRDGKHSGGVEDAVVQVGIGFGSSDTPTEQQGPAGTSSAGERFGEPRQGDRIGSCGARDDQSAAVDGADSHQTNLREKVHGI